jgi:O-antigen/teichoic acid export membrane protein
MCANLLFMGSHGVCKMLFRAKNQPAKYVAASFLISFSSIICNILFVAVYNLGVLGVLLGNMIGALAGFLFFLPTFRRNLVFAFDVNRCKVMLKYGVPLGLASIFHLIVLSSNRYFLAELQGFSETGTYALAARLASIANILVVMPLLLAWEPFLFKNEKADDYQSLFRKATSAVLILSLIIITAISLFSGPVIKIMAKNSYWPAQNVVPFLCLAWFFYIFSHLSLSGVFITGKTRLILYVNIACALLNLAANFLFIREFGAVGAGIAFAATFAFRAVANSRICPKAYRMPFSYHKLLTSTALAIGILYLSYTASPLGAAAHSAAGAALFVLFIVLLVLFRVLGKEEYAQMMRLIGEFKGKLRKRSG